MQLKNIPNFNKLHKAEKGQTDSFYFVQWWNSLIKIYYKIIWKVRAFWLVNKCVFIVLWSTKMASAMWLTVFELWEFTERASYSVCLFVKTENNNFIKEIKHVVRAFIAWWKPRRTYGRIREQISENQRPSRGFSPAREFSQTLTNKFYFLSCSAKFRFVSGNIVYNVGNKLKRDFIK